jgi:hypothetical protein
VLADEGGWLIRASAGRRIIGDHHTGRKRRPRCRRSHGGARRALWCSGSRHDSGCSTTPGCTATSARTFGVCLRLSANVIKGESRCGLHEEDR